MARRRSAEKRTVNPDPKFKDVVVSKCINTIMMEGKRSVAEAIFYDAMNRISTSANADPMSIFSKALDNTKPELEVRSRRVGGATYQVPTPVRSQRQQALALRWIVESARKRSEKTMEQRLAGEILDAANNRGTAVKKREDTHKMAEANKAFAHFAW